MFQPRLRYTVLLVGLLVLVAACGSEGATDSTSAGEAPATTADGGEVSDTTTASTPESIEAAGTEAPAEYPFQDGDTVTIIVPTSPGGGFDTEARLVQPHLEEVLSERAGGSVTVRAENAPGGDGRIGAQRVYLAGPDDNLVWYYFTNTLVGSQMEDGDAATYEASEFKPMALWGFGPSAFVLPKGLELPERSIEGLSARSEEQPLLIGGVGLDREVAIMSGLLDEAGLPFNYEIVQGSGTSDTVAFLLRQDVEVGYTTGSGLRPHVEENEELEWLASTACETDPAIPDVPTIVELGWPNAEEICAATSVPRVFAGGPQMPDEKVEALSDALVSLFESEEFQQIAAEADHPMQPGGPEEASEAVSVKRELFERFADLLGF